jgi:hypothetical protein
MGEMERNRTHSVTFMVTVPRDLDIYQKLILTLLFVASNGGDRPVFESPAELADLGGIGLSACRGALSKLKAAGFIVEIAFPAGSTSPPRTGFYIDRQILKMARAIAEVKWAGRDNHRM